MKYFLPTVTTSFFIFTSPEWTKKLSANQQKINEAVVNISIKILITMIILTWVLYAVNLYFKAVNTADALEGNRKLNKFALVLYGPLILGFIFLFVMLLFV